MEATHEQKLELDPDLKAKMIQDFVKQIIISDDDDSSSVDDNEAFDEEEEEGEEEDFSFMVWGTESSSTESEDGLLDGDVRPVFPLFNRDLFFSGEDLKSLQETLLVKVPVEKVFVETNGDDRLVTSVSSGSEEIAGPCCEWSGKAAAEPCKKSNSTGFSKLWRIKDIIGRSSSDGKDAFVLLQNSHAPRPRPRRLKEAGRAPASAHEVYLKSKAKEDDKRRSTYLPYRPELMGFFTHANVGFTKNVHPY